MRFFIALSRPYVISFGWVSFLVGKAVVELRQVLRLTLLFVFQAGMPIVPCSNSSDFPLLSLLLIARAQSQRHFPNQNFLSQIYER